MYSGNGLLNGRTVETDPIHLVSFIRLEKRFHDESIYFGNSKAVTRYIYIHYSFRPKNIP